jgi:hypothetical protein
MDSAFATDPPQMLKILQTSSNCGISDNAIRELDSITGIPPTNRSSYSEGIHTVVIKLFVPPRSTPLEIVSKVSAFPDSKLRDQVSVIKSDPSSVKQMKEPMTTVNLDHEISGNKFYVALFSTGNLLDNCTDTPFVMLIDGKKITIRGSEVFYQSFKFDFENRFDFLPLGPKEAAVLGRKKPVTKNFGEDFFENHWNPTMRFVAMLVALFYKMTIYPDIKNYLIDLLKNGLIPCEVQPNFKNDWTICERNFLSGCLVTIGLLFYQKSNMTVEDFVPEQYKQYFNLSAYQLVGPAI